MPALTPSSGVLPWADFPKIVKVSLFIWFHWTLSSDLRYSSNFSGSLTLTSALSITKLLATPALIEITLFNGKWPLYS